MLPYRHTQSGTVVRWSAVVLLPVAIGLALFVPPPRPPGVWLGPAVLTALALLSLWLMGSLTLEVDADRFRFWFGPGLIHKDVPIPAIEACEPVDKLFAWGIHYSGRRGWLYNVAGRKAVLVRLKGGKAFMVGSPEPERVCRAVAEAQAAWSAPEGREP